MWLVWDMVDKIRRQHQCFLPAGSLEFASNAQVVFENIRKRLKTFENI
jgi:hypothetical protein